VTFDHDRPFSSTLHLPAESAGIQVIEMRSDHGKQPPVATVGPLPVPMCLDLECFCYQEVSLVKHFRGDTISTS